jgi:Fe-S-cluster containining protein
MMLGGVTQEAFPTIGEARDIAKNWPYEPNGLPFIPYKVVEGYWLFACTKLDFKTGRCRDYENRPKMCREYQPLSDPLCAMYVVPPEEGL